MMRSSTPSKRPHRMTAPGPARQRRDPRLRQRHAARRHQQARAGVVSPSDAASSARASTSAFITMPGPPPAGVSSTVRCLSVACARMSTTSSDQSAGGERLAGEAHAERAREHLRKDREHARAPHGYCSSQSERQSRSEGGLFPSPLWGGVRGGGDARGTAGSYSHPPPPTLPHKGGGSAPNSRRGHRFTHQRSSGSGSLGGAAAAANAAASTTIRRPRYRPPAPPLR